MTRSAIALATTAVALVLLVAAAPATAGLRVIHGPAIPPNPRDLPANALIVGGPAVARGERASPRPPKVRLPHFHHRIAYQPTRSQAPTVSAKHRATNSQLFYHNGYVMLNDLNYLILWEPKRLQNHSHTKVPGRFNNLIARYFTDVGGSGLYNNNTQYYGLLGQGSYYYIANYSHFAGYVVDTSHYPPGACSTPRTGSNCVSDGQIQAEVRRVLSNPSVGWKPSLYNEFFVFTSKGEGTCFSPSACFPPSTGNGFCAYHSSAPIGNDYFIYANMPYLGTDLGGCQVKIAGTFPAPNGNASIDAELSTTSHEHMESVVNPFVQGGWYGTGGISDEIGDKCSYAYGSRPYLNGQANQYMNGNFYLLQEEWDNFAGGCTRFGP